MERKIDVLSDEKMQREFDKYVEKNPSRKKDLIRKRFLFTELLEKAGENYVKTELAKPRRSSRLEILRRTKTSYSIYSLHLTETKRNDPENARILFCFFNDKKVIVYLVFFDESDEKYEKAIERLKSRICEWNGRDSIYASFRRCSCLCFHGA